MKAKVSSFLILSAATLLFASCMTSKKKHVSSKSPKEIPSDYWQLVRSHPEHGFDFKQYQKALLTVSKMRQSASTWKGAELDQDWRLEGPNNIGGRIDVLTPLRTGSDTLFIGTPNGGIFRSKNAGQTWEAVFDDYGTMAIGAITVDPTNPNILFAGTGDRNFGGGSYMGNGLYRSADMGTTWSHVGLAELGIITACDINPTNTNEMVLGALGNPFEKTNERGVYYSSDGGQTWQNTLFVSDSSGVTEIVRDPSNAQVLYATSFNRLNLPTRSISSGPDAKIFKSTDGGQNWTQLTNGLPPGNHSRVGIAVAASNPNKLYAVYVGTDLAFEDIYTSNNAGESWSSLKTNNGLLDLDPEVFSSFGWYFGRIYVNPWNENHLILPGVEQFASEDGGMSWKLNVPNWWTYEVHADEHDVVFQDSLTILIGTDGGLYETNDAGVFWSERGRLPITQFYRITARTFSDGTYAGGAQDNGTTSGNYLTNEWNRDFGGDGFQVTYIDPSDESIIFETQNAGLYWYDNIDFGVDMSPSESPTNWDTPYRYAGNRTVVAGSNRLIRMDEAPYGLWSNMTDDLTRSGLGLGVEANRYHTITEIGLNPADSIKLLVGTSDGLVWKGDIDGNMSNITQNLPERYVTEVCFSKKDPTTFYVAMSGYYSNLQEAQLYKSIDAGQTWQSIAGNLPAIGINSLKTLIQNELEILFVGTDGGVFVSSDQGTTWDLLGKKLPLTTISDLDIDPINKRLVAGTYGRSMWSYDISYWFQVAPPVGLEELSLNTNIYPNPAQDQFVVGVSVENLKISTVSGKLVLEKTGVKAGETISLVGLTDGTYVLQADGKSTKLVVRH